MNRMLLAGTALLMLINAGVPAHAAHKRATRYQVPVQPHWFGSGARIDEVDANSPAARAGMRPGDVVIGVNGSPVNSMYDIHVGQNGRPLTVDVNRGGTLVRLRATPQRGRPLGITGTVFGFGIGGSGQGDPPPPYIPPPAPDPPIPPPPPMPPQF